MEKIDDVISFHRESYPDTGEIRVFACPGRINLIGEHIDYNGGYVFPAAVNREIYVSISPNNREVFRFISMNFKGFMEIPVDEINEYSFKNKYWWLYPLGAVKLFGEKWDKGYDLSFYSDIPVGAGMSSSAAITVATLYSLIILNNLKVGPIELAKTAQKVEIEIAGVDCGLMDQIAVILGKKNNALLVNTKNLSYTYISIDSNITRFILINSGVSHSLRESEYNLRRAECKKAAAVLKEAGVKIDYLSELSYKDFQNYMDYLSHSEQKRVRHVISENRRTIDFHQRVNEYDFKSAGEILYESHRSLKDDYEVSIPLIDEMVEWTKGINGVYGARIMGGGFGGCTLNMVAVYAIEEFKEFMANRFESRFKKKPEIYDCTIEDGVREVSHA